MIYNIIGLILDLIGVLLLFIYGILPNNLWEHLLMDSGMSEKDEKRHKIWSKIAMSLIFIGFTLQLIGAVSQYNFSSSNQNTFLGKEQNLTTGIVGDLKLKFQSDLLHYQIELVGLTKSFRDVTKFHINLEDTDGFEITTIDELKNDNLNSTWIYKKDSLLIAIKNTIPFTSKNYSQIKKWKLTINK